MVPTSDETINDVIVIIDDVTVIIDDVNEIIDPNFISKSDTNRSKIVFFVAKVRNSCDSAKHDLAPIQRSSTQLVTMCFHL